MTTKNLVPSIMESKANVTSSKINVSGIPTKVFTTGADIHDRPKDVILIIPGK